MLKCAPRPVSELRSYLEAIFLGIVEGVTEFLPVSSTGHLIVAEELLGMPGEQAKTFLIFIQLGAILAVMWDRRTRLDFKRAGFWHNGVLLFIAFLPAAFLGFLAHGFIKAKLFSSTVVAWSLIAGAGVKRGFVYGKSDTTASAPLETPVHPCDLLATIYNAVGLSAHTIVYNHLNQPRELVKGSLVTGLLA